MEEGRSKCLDQGNGWNEGGTCTVYDGLCSGRRKMPRQTTMVVQISDEGFGGLDGLHGYGGKNGRGGIGKREIKSQRVGSSSISIIDS